MARWVYERATGKLMLQFRDPSIIHSQPNNYAEIETGDLMPHPIFERVDPVTLELRPATAPEVLESRRDAAEASASAAVDVGTFRTQARALCFALLWERLGTQPTAPQFQAEWTTFRARLIAGARLF